MYLPVDAQLVEVAVKSGDNVQQGQVLMRLVSPALEQQSRLTENDIHRLEGMLAGFSVNEELFRNRLVLEQELARAMTQRLALEREQAMLTVKAPFAGQVRDIDAEMLPGRWLGEASHLVTVVAPHKAEVLAWVTEQDKERIRAGAHGHFWAEVSHGPLGVPVTVTAVDASAIRTLDPPFQAAEFGGEIVVNEGHNGELQPRQALYRVRLAVDESNEVTQRWRGHVRVEGERRSWLGQALTWVLGALIRESGL
jgi:putative peptide zinc metalloprotease protein